MTIMRSGQHIIAVILLVVSSIRAGSSGGPLFWVIAGSTLFFLWYTLGSTLSTDRILSSKFTAALWLYGLTLGWVGLVLISSEFTWLAFLLWLIAGQIFRGILVLAYAGIVYAAVLFAPLIHEEHLSYAGIIGPLVGGVFALGISRGYLVLVREAHEREQLVHSLQNTQTEMAQLQEELAQSQREAGAIAERTRIARELHDSVAQSLSSIRLLAHAATTSSPPSTALPATLNQIEELAQQGLTETRRIMAALVPVELDEHALSAALSRIVTSLRAQTDLDISLHVDEQIPILPTNVEVALLRILQSALANVQQHAQAGRVAITLSDTGNTVRLDIRDDGVGFNPAQFEKIQQQPDISTAASPHFGLAFIRARLRELGGGLEVESTPNAGTALSVYIPILNPSEGHQ